jgi:hypothetical protein
VRAVRANIRIPADLIDRDHHHLQSDRDRAIEPVRREMSLALARRRHIKPEVVGRRVSADAGISSLPHDRRNKHIIKGSDVVGRRRAVGNAKSLPHWRIYLIAWTQAAA